MFCSSRETSYLCSNTEHNKRKKSPNSFLTIECVNTKNPHLLPDLTHLPYTQMIPRLQLCGDLGKAVRKWVVAVSRIPCMSLHHVLENGKDVINVGIELNNQNILWMKYSPCSVPSFCDTFFFLLTGQHFPHLKAT